MAELILDKQSGSIHSVTIGATPAEGGTRSASLTVGGQKALPYLFADGQIPHAPVVAFEIWDCAPDDWPQETVDAYGAAITDPVAWAQQCVSKFNAKILCLNLQGAHPDRTNHSASSSAALVAKILKAVPVPLIILGCGDDAKDNLVLPAVCEAAKGERCLIGSCVQNNYKTLVAAAVADKQNVIAESPIDINIAKQLNILISDMGLPLDRIVINPTIGALGYGLEYAYSIMERARLAALAGDKTLASPFICFVGLEAARAKEVRASVREFPAWGDRQQRCVAWELLTATTLLQAGADILVMCHPEAILRAEAFIRSLMQR